MEADNPSATAVAVSGKRIVAVGSLDQVKAALGDRPYRVDDDLRRKIVLPGFIDQHLHPILGALTLAVEVIATGGLGTARQDIQGRHQSRRLSGAPEGGRSRIERPRTSGC